MPRGSFFLQMTLNLLFDQLLDFGHSIFHALLENSEDLVSGLEVPEEYVVVERRSVFGVEGVDVFLGKEEMAEIENLE